MIVGGNPPKDDALSVGHEDIGKLFESIAPCPEWILYSRSSPQHHPNPIPRPIPIPHPVSNLKPKPLPIIPGISQPCLCISASLHIFLVKIHLFLHIH